MMQTHYPQRVRNALRFRELTVLRSERIGGRFQRIVLGGQQLDGFGSQGFDDHSKVFFPAPGIPFVAPDVTADGIVWQSDVRPPARDYTPLYDAQRHELALDFFLHTDGLASDWAQQARVGDRLTIGGPRGSLVVPLNYGFQLYACDESGMPALRRRLEALRELPARPRIQALVAVSDAACRTYLAHLNEFDITWLPEHDRQALDDRLAQLAVPQEDYFLWITGEGKYAKHLSRHFENDRFDPQLVRTVAY